MEINADPIVLLLGILGLGSVLARMVTQSLWPALNTVIAPVNQVPSQ
jgi:hypothetical protein